MWRLTRDVRVERHFAARASIDGLAQLSSSHFCTLFLINLQCKAILKKLFLHPCKRDKLVFWKENCILESLSKLEKSRFAVFARWLDPLIHDVDRLRLTP